MSEAPATDAPIDPPAEDSPVLEQPTAPEPEPVTPEPEPAEPEPTDPEPGPNDEVATDPTPDEPVADVPVGSVTDRALRIAAEQEDDAVRELLLTALADQKVYSQDQDLRHRMKVSDDIRQMVRWIRTNIPSSSSFKSFMDGVNTYLTKVETEGIPTLWSQEAQAAPVNELMARRDAMAIEKALARMEIKAAENPEANPEVKQVPGHLIRDYAKQVREGKIK